VTRVNLSSKWQAHVKGTSARTLLRRASCFVIAPGVRSVAVTACISFALMVRTTCGSHYDIHSLFTHLLTFITNITVSATIFNSHYFFYSGCEKRLACIRPWRWRYVCSSKTPGFLRNTQRSTQKTVLFKTETQSKKLNPSDCLTQSSLMQPRGPTLENWSTLPVAVRKYRSRHPR
jgi:hypothetical protein